MKSGNYYIVPNELMKLHLCAGEIAVYNYLLFCENRTTYQCYPGYRTIGNAIGMSKNTVKKYVAQLEEKQLIETEPTEVILRNGKHLNGHLLYTILPIDKAVEYYHQQQVNHAKLNTERQRVQVRIRSQSESG